MEQHMKRGHLLGKSDESSLPLLPSHFEDYYNDKATMMADDDDDDDDVYDDDW